jgi:hypothetical protein
MRVVVLDAGPLNLAGQPRGQPDADRCRAWLLALDVAGVRVVVPEIAAYEVRRKLLHIGATAGWIGSRSTWPTSPSPRR